MFKFVLLYKYDKTTVWLEMIWSTKSM